MELYIEILWDISVPPNAPAKIQTKLNKTTLPHTSTGMLLTVLHYQVRHVQIPFALRHVLPGLVLVEQVLDCFFTLFNERLNELTLLLISNRGRTLFSSLITF